MSKSDRQKSKTKRDRSRLVMQQASPASGWETLDVSGWFDSSVGSEQNDLKCFYPEDKSLPSPVYKDVLPGEYYLSFYAHEHPEKEDETAAVRLIKSWICCRRRTGPDADPTMVPRLLKDLQKLAENGCVTANSFLGHLCNNGSRGKKTGKGQGSALALPLKMGIRFHALCSGLCCRKARAAICLT